MTAPEPADFSKVPEEYRELLEKYKDIWPKDLPAGLPPLRTGVEIVIPFDSQAIPVASYRMRYSPAEIEEARKQVKRFLEKGFVMPSTSPYGASILFTPKKDGGLRMCIDYRRVNAQTRKDKHPLPRADELLDQLHGADTFSGLDLLSGYHQVRVHPSDIPQTAFRTSEGLYEWLVMPFGLSNAPGIFQRVMNNVFRDHLGKSVNVYLDDIMVYSQEPKEEAQHDKHKLALEPVFIKMREHRLYGKLSKSFFGQHEIPWLGQILNKEGVRPDPAKTEVVADWPRPDTVKELQSFLGFANWFRQYMQGYSQHTAVLTKLTRKNQAYVWTPECEEAFLWVKQALANAPVLAHADFTKPFTVWTDASIDGVGAVLQQEKRPIAYESARFSPAERNYTIGEQELLAVIHALKKWRVYLEGGPHPVRLRTDHQPLTYLPTKGVLGGRQVRWAEYLSRFDIEWEYIPGQRNIADALSRMPTLRLYVTTRSQAQQVSDVGVKPSGRALADSLISPRVEKESHDKGPVDASLISPRVEKDVDGASDRGNTLKDAGQMSRTPEVMRDSDDMPLDDRRQANEADFLDRVRAACQDDSSLRNRSFRKRFASQHGLFWRGMEGQEDMPMYVPENSGNALRNECIEWLHIHPFAGHVGMRRNLSEILRRHFWWSGMEADVTRYVGNCEMCIRNKSPNTKKAGLLAPLPIPGRPWESIGMDFITHLPKTKTGYTALYVVIDRLTKLVHIAPTTNTATAADTAQLFLDMVFKHHGLPRNIVSDRDVKFTSSFWTSFCEQVGIMLKMSSAYHPQTDGQTERMNRVIVDMMRHYINPTHDDWDEHLTAMEFAINNAFQQSIGTTPFRLTYGQGLGFRV